MSEPTNKPGTPIWADLGSKDRVAAVAFYTQLFGWDAEELGPETGNYTFVKKDGKIVAAIGSTMSEEQPTVWSSYLYVTDASATAEAVKAAGGTVLVEPFDVMDQGRMAVFMDPSGGAISVWQPIKMFGAELVNAPDAVGWTELNSRDIEGAKEFYSKVFGLGFEEGPLGDIGNYVTWTVDGAPVAGGMAMPEGVPDEAPSFWLVYFVVMDVDATVAKAKELGGSISMGPAESPQGPFAILIDPQGGMFAVIQNSEPE